MSVQVRKGGELQTQDLGEGVSITIHIPSLLPAATMPASTWQPHDVTDSIGSVTLSVDAATEKGRSSKRDAENPIHKTMSKTTSDMFSLSKRPTGICLQS